MNKWIAIALIALLACQLGDAVKCYTCPYTTCLTPSTTNCGAMEVCLTKTIVVGQLPIKQKSCSSPDKCVGSSETTYVGIKVTETPSCCSTDLCNSAAMPSVSIVTGIAVLLSLWVARLF
ncbi:prostate stem cell antigen-like [Pseudophryne corroboree]|uniref:prostate stem cell antigen-like n=1 Tax=Pseudophryne corroboree TaxID=495146 RepID=UPI003081F0EB